MWCGNIVGVEEDEVVWRMNFVVVMVLEEESEWC